MMQKPNLALALVIVLLTLVAGGSVGAQRLQRGRVDLSAAQQNFFPLETGNSWTYVLTGFAAQGSVTVRVGDSADVNGRRYYRLEGYTPEPVLVRVTREGRLIEFRQDSGSEHLWYDFGASQGVGWTSELPLECIGPARLGPTVETAEVPSGSFDRTTTVSYGPTNCADAGLTEEVFAAGVGLLRRTMLTIGGPRSMELISARVGSQEIGRPRLTFSLSIDQPVYFANLMPPVDPERSIPTVHAALRLENSSNQPLTITTPSGQQFELVIRNQEGDEVFRWSEGRFFTQAITTIDLSPGEKVYTADVPLSTEEGEPLPPARYVVEGWITSEAPDAYRATAAFELQHVF